MQAICTSERLTVNTDALTRLADRSHLDVRSCLNTLQFVARRAASGGVRNASAALLTAVAEGIKDERRDLFEGMYIGCLWCLGFFFFFFGGVLGQRDGMGCVWGGWAFGVGLGRDVVP